MLRDRCMPVDLFALTTPALTLAFEPGEHRFDVPPEGVMFRAIGEDQAQWGSATWIPHDRPAIAASRGHPADADRATPVRLELRPDRADRRQ